MSDYTTTVTRRVAFTLTALAIAGVTWIAHPAGQARPLPSTKNGDWTHYTADARGTKYSPLDQINASNFNKLEVAWRFKTDNFGTRPEYKLEGTPLVINGVLYTTAGTRRSVIALDGRTGELIWSHSYREGNRAAIAPRQLSGRGVSYWTDGKGDDRVLYVTTGYRLVALNAKTGAPISSLRRRGHRRSEEGRGVRQPASRSIWRPARSGSTRRRPSSRTSSSSARRSRKALTVKTHNNTKGLVRAFDVAPASCLDVQHHPAARRVRQRHVGERFVGGQRQHRRVDADHRRRGAGLVYLPVEIADLGFLRRPSPGQQPVRREPGLRRSEDRPAQVALPGRAPSDLGLRPVVGADARWTSTSTASAIKAVALPSKEAFLYVFDRITGQPVWPIEERPVPQSDVPGEKTSPTQPFPTKPPAYARNVDGPTI